MRPGLVARIVTMCLIALIAPAQGATSTPSPAERLADAHAEFERSRSEDVDIEALVVELEGLADALETGGEDSLAVIALEDLGTLHAQGGRLERAREVLERGLALAQRGRWLRREATLRADLAVNSALAGDFEGMIGATRDILPVARELDDVDLERRCWFNICVAYTKLGRTPDALVAVRRALTLARELDQVNRMASAWAMVAELQNNLGQLELALASADSAVHYSRVSGEMLPLSAALLVRGRLLTDLGDPASAVEGVDEAVRLRRGSGLEVYLPLALLVRAQLELALGVPERCLETVEELRPLVEAQGDPTQTMETRLIGALAKLRLERLDEAESDLLALRDEYEAIQRELADDASVAGLYRVGGEAYAGLAEVRAQRGDLAGAWRALERGSSPRLRHRRGDGQVGLSKLQEILERRNARLLHFADSSQLPLSMVVVSPDTVERHVLGPPTKLATRLRDLIQRLVEDRDLLAVEADLRTLGEELLGPVAAELSALSVDRVFLIVPSVLAGFPLELLGHPVLGDRALGEAHTVSYLPYAALLNETSDPSSGEGLILAVADPALTDSTLAATTLRGQTLESLRYAREETELFPPDQTTTLVGAAATREAVETALRRDNIAVVHLATHALVAHDVPANSCLVLAGAGGILPASSIERLEIDADLVTLSACRTNEGYAYMGEGAFSLARSFLVAGADVVVASLWDVEDRATAHFMRHFYAAMSAGSPPAAALRAARRELRDEGASLRDRMAFVLTGNDDRPVVQLAGAVRDPHVGHEKWWLGFVALFALIVLLGLLRRSAVT